ncbi:hypothetical protein [Azospirillum thermophilum]|uniref:Uncharacterized protein n=1 Tax=Azospirillum thermophilum TaxID=2202148 RepID=A0A2S2CVE0_9PROT|nr:hypothetical protein [Azospirillum thermophilum]AWK88448.1 hypothetical protein DEW08_20470 [Azospirillum thermophilum]
MLRTGSAPQPFPWLESVALLLALLTLLAVIDAHRPVPGSDAPKELPLEAMLSDLPAPRPAAGSASRSASRSAALADPDRLLGAD